MGIELLKHFVLIFKSLILCDSGGSWKTLVRAMYANIVRIDNTCCGFPKDIHSGVETELCFSWIFNYSKIHSHCLCQQLFNILSVKRDI